MTQIIDVSKHDVIYLSYDEPNAENHYSKLVSLIPHAKRVHGVKGSDSAHKAAARIATTDRFTVVDGDNLLAKENFLSQKILINDESVNLSESVISWPSYNIVNGLLYGNGGIKCWPTELALKMNTHENADPANLKSQVDFCWDINYIPLDLWFSEIRNNASPLQAWRAGFREGVKMSLDQGVKVTHASEIWHGNLKRLLVWMTVGADVTNGLWSILGARMGCYMTLCTDWDHINVRDFDYLNSFWTNNVENIRDVNEEISNYDNSLKYVINVPEALTRTQSKFFKLFNINIPRQPDYVTVTV